jgi:hypothetical protein
VLWNLFQEVPQDDDTNTSREASQPKKVGADPFDNEETDPTKSGAMRKYQIISNIFCLVTSPFNPQSVLRQKRQTVVMVLQIGYRKCSSARASLRWMARFCGCRCAHVAKGKEAEGSFGANIGNTGFWFLPDLIDSFL